LFYKHGAPPELGEIVAIILQARRFNGVLAPVALMLCELIRIERKII